MVERRRIRPARPSRSGRLLRPLVAADPRACRRIVGWSRARSTWRQRAAAVAFVSLAHRGQHDREILTVCPRIVRTDERFVQLGMGWVLRELWRASPDAVVAFLGTHRARIRREALRYAVEKMPPALQRRLPGEHAAGAPRPRAVRT